jgi:hypothetical protein
MAISSGYQNSKKEQIQKVNKHFLPKGVSENRPRHNNNIHKSKHGYEQAQHQLALCYSDKSAKIPKNQK